MVCKKCGAQLDVNYAFCPKCGNRLKVKKKSALGKIIGIVLFLAILGSGVFLYVSGYYKNITLKADNTSEEITDELVEDAAVDSTNVEVDIEQETKSNELQQDEIETVEEDNEIEQYLESLTLEAVEMTMGETFQVELEKEVPEAIWISSDEKIVHAADGKLKAIAPGNVVVTLSSEGKDISFDVAVNAFSDMTVAVNYSIALELNDAISGVQWESSYPEIVSVNDGIVNALEPGASTITAYIDGAEYSFEVVATTPEISTTSVRKIIGNTVQVSILGTNGKAEWKSDNTAIATVSDTGLITAEPTGAGQNTVVHAYIDGMEFKVDVAVEPIPQLSSTYKIYGHQDNSTYKNANISLCTNANEILKSGYKVSEYNGKSIFTCEIENVLNVADADYSDGSTYPLYRTFRTSDDSSYTDIYLVGTSQTADVMIQKVYGESIEHTNSIATYEQGDGYGIIHIYDYEIYSGSSNISNHMQLVTVTVDGYKYQLAIQIIEKGSSWQGDFEYFRVDKIPANYMIEQCSIDEVVEIQNTNYAAVSSNSKTYNPSNDWLERVGTKFIETVEDQAIEMAVGALFKIIF